MHTSDGHLLLITETHMTALRNVVMALNADLECEGNTPLANELANVIVSIELKQAELQLKLPRGVRMRTGCFDKFGDELVVTEGYDDHPDRRAGFFIAIEYVERREHVGSYAGTINYRPKVFFPGRGIDSLKQACEAVWQYVGGGFKPRE